MTYRERREARAERLEEWAAKRQADARAVLRSHEVYRGDHAFNFQPGHIPERARVIRQADRAFRSMDKAESMASRASGIQTQLDTSIYSDDVDAVERLEERIEELSAKRDRMKAENAAYRAEHKAELKAMNAYDRDVAIPHASFTLTNLGTNINRNRKRLEQLKREAAIVATGSRGRGRPMVSRFASDCAECGNKIDKGAEIIYYRLTREAIHAACLTEQEA